MSKFLIKGNENYCATVVKINEIVMLENRDNIVGTFIFGNHVIISKTTKIGDIGIYFPVETALSDEFLRKNNLYRDSSLNEDKSIKGYFESNRRVKCVQFSGHKSEGLFLPISSIKHFTDDIPEVGTDFDHIDNIKICEKYIVNAKNIQLPKTKIKESKYNKKLKKLSKMIENQFAFHNDTQAFGKHIDKFYMNDLISITYKMHGTSAIFSKIICKKPLSKFESILKKCGINIVDTQYDNVYASRKVIKNKYFNPDASTGFYDVDIWGLANEVIDPHLDKGMTIYGEIVGYLPNGTPIQSLGEAYDYGCLFTNESDYVGKTGKEMHDMGLFEIYVYRITSTNVDGVKYEWSAKQVQQWCKLKGIKAVPELFYGYVKDYLNSRQVQYNETNFREKLLLTIMQDEKFYMEKECFMCYSKVPAEGVVIRKEIVEAFEAYKCKTFRFKTKESKELDKGIENIEDNQ